MIEDPFDLIRDPGQGSSPAAREETWITARETFLRERESQVSPWRKWRWGAAAAVAALAIIMWGNQKAPERKPEPPGLLTEIDTLYRQGYELFGSRLIAVSVSKEKVTWHLDESSVATPEMDQFVTLHTVDGHGNQISMAVVAGVPVRVPCEDQELEMEFLPDGADEVMAYGDGIYWESGAPDFPVHEVKLQTRCHF